MTIGQRIQELRKDQGMSQEALGEALGVSRQAVSKWESDGAIPELEKLIAMSRLFRLPLNRLLGVEDAAYDDEVQKVSSSLPIVEPLNNLLENYLNEVQKQAKKLSRQRIWLIGASAAALCISLGITIFMTIRTQRLGDEIKRLSSHVSSVESSISHQISSITSSLSNIIEEEESIFSECSAKLISVDLDNKQVCYRVLASLKNYDEGCHGVFILSYTDTQGLIQTVESPALSGPLMTDDIWVPYNNECSVMLDITQPDGKHVNQIIDKLYDCSEEDFSISIEGSPGYSYTQVDKNNYINFSLSGICDLYYKHDNTAFELTAESVQVALYQNDKLLYTKELIRKDDEMYFSDSATVSIVSHEQYEIPERFHGTFQIQDGDIFTIIFSVEDNYGRVTYSLGGYDKAIKFIENGSIWEQESLELTNEMIPKQ